MNNDTTSYRSLPSEAQYLEAKAPSVSPRPTPTYSRSFPGEQSSEHAATRRHPPRVSIFKELDVDMMLDAQTNYAHRNAINSLSSRPIQRLRSQLDSTDSMQSDDASPISPDRSESSGRSAFSTCENEWTTSWRALSSSRLMMLALVLLVAIPLLYDTPLLGKAGTSIIGAKAGVIRSAGPLKKDFIDGKLVTRQDITDTDVCNRWSQQSALVNGTIYLYGGHTTTTADQTSDTWNNDFLTIDVTKSWDISTPVISGLPQPSGPPPVSNGYIWNSYDTLYLYGGEYSSDPITTPSAYSLWQYDIASSTWTETQIPQTSAGNNSDGGNQPVLGSAEGAGISVPELGRGFYFAGHQDAYTTPGWSQSIYRIYLKSLLEFTFPGYSNNGVQSLSGGKTAGSGGVWRNVTLGGIQDTALFPNRADGVILYVPGYGVNGILVSMAGGTNESFTQMNVIDVYDVASSTWYRQSTSGAYPILRVNPCAVALSAPDGSSTNIYMYGGQNLIPYGNQTQYSDMWILTIPSFTWIQVDTTGQSVPPGRTGHTCNTWNGQIVVVGGYTGPPSNGLGCDSGFYVFNATSLQWQNNYNSLSGSDTQNQQISQQKDASGLSGSYGYEVPVPVQSVIGGKGSGGATVTAPAETATAGPLATGKAITYTLTGSNGAVVTETGTASSTTSSSASNNGKGGPNIGAIVAGVVAGCFAVLAAYLGFCAWVYRRQLVLYKNHVAMSQRATAAGGGEKSAFLAPTSSEGSSAGKKYSADQSSRKAGSAGSSRYTAVPPLPNAGEAPLGGNSTANSSVEDLAGEPSFVGVLLNPRRSLRVINRD